MKKVKWYFIAVALVAISSAFATRISSDDVRYFRNGDEIFDTSPCLEAPIEDVCYEIRDTDGETVLQTVHGLWEE